MAGYPWYRWFVETWRASETRHRMTMEERGLYREALDLQAIEGSIPRDLTVLRRMIAADPIEFDRSWPAVSDKFVPYLTDRLINLRQRDELTRRDEVMGKRLKAAASGGKQSGKVRRAKSKQMLQKRRSKIEQIEIEIESQISPLRAMVRLWRTMEPW